MSFLQHLIIKIILLLFAKNPIKCEPDWTYDLVDITIENYTPEIIYVDLVVTRPKRGIFAFSGFIDVKEDLTDDLHFGATTYFSFSGGKANYIKTPFNIPESNLTNIMNVYYKNMAMESFLNCSENSVNIKDKFVTPLTKRLTVLNNCIISNENMPSKLKSGYYKIIFIYTKQARGNVELIVKVEPK